MKILSLLLFVVNFSINCYSQSKIETQTWIKNNLEAHAGEKLQFTNIDFENSNLIIKSPIGDKEFYDLIPLKEINQIIFKEFEFEGKEKISIQFYCKNGNKCRQSGEIVDGKKTASDFNYFDTKIILNGSFKNDGIPSRMLKAFSHLIKLCGGKLINDIF